MTATPRPEQRPAGQSNGAIAFARSVQLTTIGALAWTVATTSSGTLQLLALALAGVHAVALIIAPTARPRNRA
ncbi:hypothetical protein ACQP10_38265 (plasmid) [Streptosporangium sandarakinum]|uniref:hypothetical protein n=1 Tax=Streptosporangium sandarakinum TaxID=1260955 RepID=UPI003D937128